MSRRKSGFWKQYEETALMIVGYGQACDFCAWFIIHLCLPSMTTHEEESDRIALVEILIRRYEAVENYEACSKLLSYKNGFDISEIVCKIGMEDYVFNALAVLNYHANIEECSEVFREYGLLAFNPWIPSAGDIDYIEVADRVLEYLKMNGEIELCEHILKKRGQVIKYRATGRL